MCQGKLLEKLLVLAILVWTIWPDLLGISSYWLIIVASVLVLIHMFGCRNCCGKTSSVKAKLVRARPKRRVAKKKANKRKR